MSGKKNMASLFMALRQGKEDNIYYCTLTLKPNLTAKQICGLKRTKIWQIPDISKSKFIPNYWYFKVTVSGPKIFSKNADVNKNWMPFSSLTVCISYENLHYSMQNLFF